MSTLKKNVAGQNVTFGLVSATTGAADPSATVTIYVVKDNGAQATGTGTVTNAGNGQYNYAPTQAETNATCVGFSFQATGDIPVFYNFLTDIVDANGFTSINVVDWNGTTVATPATAGIPDVNVKNINNAAAATPGASGGIVINGANVGALTESYAALHAAPTINQILYEIRSILAENAVSGTAVTTKKIDGTTTAETFTIDSAATPTSITRAS